MKNLLLFLGLIIFSGLNAQPIKVKGRVFDKQTGENLAFANVFSSEFNGTTTDEQGYFQLDIPQNTSFFQVSYTGYQSIKITVDPAKDFYKVFLQPVNEQLNEVYLSAKGRNPALEILQKAVKKKKFNDYRKIKIPILTTNYFLFKLTADRDSINPAVDTVTYYKKGKTFVRKDSSMYHLYHDLEQHELYMMESLTKNSLVKGELRHEVIAGRTAGFKNPVYEILQLQFSGANPYDDYYRIMFKEYLGPFSKNSVNHYRYKLVDTIEKQGRLLYKIHFSKKEKPHISGDLYLDTQSLALAGLNILAKGQLIITTSYHFTYFKKQNIWIPVLQRSIIRLSKDFSEFSVGENIRFKTNIPDNGMDSIKHTNPQTVNDVLYAKIVDSLVRIKFDSEKNVPLYSLQVSPGATKKEERYWKELTGKVLTPRERNTYKIMDSLFKEENIEQNINKYKKLMYGKWPLGKVDLDLTRLSHTNLYEGLRLETNFTTNEWFSNKWKVNLYAGYGFKDHRWKYGGSIGYKLSHQHQLYLQASYANDLQKAAVFSSLQKPELLTSVFQHYPWEKFTVFEEYSLKLKTLFSQHTSFAIEGSRGFYETKFAIPVHPGRIEFKEYDLSRWKMNLQWEPHSQYILEEAGYRKIKNAYPKLFFGLEGNFPQWQTDRRYYLRTEIQALFRKKYVNKDYTDFKIQLGMSFGRPRIQQLFQPEFNDYKGGWFWQHLMFANPYSFETVKDLEFLNDYIVSGHFSHRINGIKTFKNKKIDLRFTTAVAYGFAWDENTYSGSSDLRYGLYESGVEVYKLLKGFGFGFYYRYGAYAKSEWKENLSLRFNFKPFLLFK